MHVTSTPRPDAPRSQLELYTELKRLADRYFNGPFIYPDTREQLGLQLREVLLTLDTRVHAE